MADTTVVPIPSRKEMNEFILGCVDGSSEHVTKFLTVFGLSVIDGIADNGITPLGAAATAGNLEVVRTLLEKGAAVNARDKYQYTALLWAAGEYNLEVIELLIEKGAEINVMSSSGYTPLIWASLRGREKIVSYLLNHGADVDLQDSEGRTSEVCAERMGYPAVVQLIKEHKIRLEIKKAFEEVLAKERQETVREQRLHDLKRQKKKVVFKRKV